ncbi:MAG: histidine phosphatase family protein [Rhodospirillaceae bacterium]|jgi:phosphohistidine phosphatase|nr:histidine phosphatase family protein [Rhodospirillaceae bacterium]MBT3492299.1 histidine phosphatase family protein [Rhodospirillaceae bacterium]MBT3782340.1 histidine phosphatase family protein [Rhodospirillaceae bacterium]MBT3975154.1 histidine phosphatase family protein [Rhodospirillaceae bacterium]MBT4166836.1 histidine phosphatase family protein [Rhodospirillaceae bacterium]
MPTLYLLRHGNAGFGGPGQQDQDRALNPAGRQAAALVGRYLAQMPARLDLVLCSTAERTRQTWALVAAELDNPPQAEFDEALYLCSGAALQQRVRGLPQAADSVMIIGHNPGLYDTALFYSGGGDSDVIGQSLLDFPPAALVALQFDHPWAAASQQAGHLDFVVTPRDLVET